MTDDNKLLWLEEVEGEKAINWVKEQNKITENKFKGSNTYRSLFEKADEILNSSDRIPYAYFHGEYLYNLWQDKDHEKGLYRRTSLEEYRKENPKWETVLDLDKLSQDENEDWVWHGSSALSSDSDRALLYLSRGGKDACVIREFDFKTKQFITDGFNIAESKLTVAWVDDDTLLLGTTLDGEPQTDSGYPSTLSIWKRGTKISEAKRVFELDKTDMGVWCHTAKDGEKFHTIIDKRITFYTGETYLLIDGTPKKVMTPDFLEFNDIYNNQLLFLTRKDWKLDDTTFTAGSIIAIDIDCATKKLTLDAVTLVMEASKCNIPKNTLCTKDKLYAVTMNNVNDELWSFEFENKEWKGTRVDLPSNGAIDPITVNEKCDQLIVSYENFLTPSSLMLIDSGKISKIRGIKEKFDGSKYRVEQHFATSKDGEKIPYFQISNKDLELNGSNPTLQYGYGGFEIPLTPGYLALAGNLWLEQGGVHVLTNIRGGGEFGPRWHQAALKENRQRAYDDFAAISEDLISRGVTSQKHLGIMGGSNGGLLMGVMTTQRPDLYNAVVCQVPLLDMKRYHKLLAGASWVGEYGNPDDPKEWEFISKYSPLQNVFEDKSYPPIIFMTSTKDDRVHPGHARKMAAKMKAQNHEVEYFENINGGHGGTTTQSDRAHWQALQYSFLLEKLK